MICVQLLPVSSSGIEASGLVDVVSEAWICSYMMYTKSDKVMREREKVVYMYGHLLLFTETIMQLIIKF